MVAQVAAVQFIVQSVQDVMLKWDGSFMQFRCDEKGFVGICAFGLPGHTHEDNASRGILAALELMKRVKWVQSMILCRLRGGGQRGGGYVCAAWKGALCGRGGACGPLTNRGHGVDGHWQAGTLDGEPRTAQSKRVVLGR